MEVGATAAVTIPFVTSSVTPTPERKSGGRTDSITGPNLRTQHPAERFVISSDSSHHSSANVADDEVTFIVRSSVPPPPVLTAAVATTAIAGATSAPVHESGTGPVQRIIFRDSASPSTAGVDIAGPSQPAGAEVFTDTFYISQEMDSETLQQTYVPKWNVINDSALDDPEFNVGVARQACFSDEVRWRSEHNYRERKKFERKYQRQVDLLKEKDTEIASLKSQLSLKEAEAAEAIRLRGLVATVEAAEATQVNELNGLKEQNSALEEEKHALKHKVAALESTDAAKVIELTSLTAQTAKLTQDLSELGLSCDELSVKASSLEAERDRLVGQVSLLEDTCSELRDEVSGYKLFKEQIEAVQDEQVKVLSDKVAELDFDLIGTTLHLDEEFYPRFLTTIARRRWILGRRLRLVVMTCLQSPEYLAALGGAIGRAIDKGMQDGLAAGIDHGKAGRGLVDVAAYNPSAEANYISTVNALRAVDFPLLAQLESQKDASMADIMSLLHLDDLAAEILEADQLQPSPEQLMLPIHRSKDQVVIGETSLSFYLDVVHARVRRIRGDATSQRLSISDAMVPLIEPLSAKNLVGEASTSGVPTAVAATTALTTFVQASSVPPIPVSDYEVADTEAQAEASSSPKIIFEQENLETSPENPAT
ncbi:hypothetical protein Tco_0865559 [Tanacetum coccineum]